MSSATHDTKGADLGWRFVLGFGLIVGGYVAWGLIPVVAASGMALGAKSAITGCMAVTPVITKIAAVAVMGKPGFDVVRRHASRSIGLVWPDRVSRGRYRLGTVILVASIAFDFMLPYLPGVFVDWKMNEMFWVLVGDIGIVTSFLVLGGGFWNKVLALFSYDAAFDGGAGSAEPSQVARSR